uniref:Uncharacterized protein n=1 Tax=Nelumbo nucifera TaxID=4432 RepID=A0A822YH70_NELNU|nr:TPA_asm: hypothetical protein HUJ06_009480 [Nelumbo nucifera]
MEEASEMLQIPIMATVKQCRQCVVCDMIVIGLSSVIHNFSFPFLRENQRMRDPPS